MIPEEPENDTQTPRVDAPESTNDSQPNSNVSGEDTKALARDRGLILRLPAPAYCMDNAAMIAGLAAARYAAGRFDDWTLSAATHSAVREGWVAI